MAAGLRFCFFSGGDGDGCVADACRGSSPVKRCIVGFIREFQSPMKPHTFNTVVGGGFHRQRWRRRSFSDLVWCEDEGAAAGSFLRRLDPGLMQRRRVSNAKIGVGHVRGHAQASDAWL
ncbi:hypothetical protein Rs2_26864 [Raphanus sativus]|nr:hypothetical protein Rs2_26864 [Raphanus sativus]